MDDFLIEPVKKKSKKTRHLSFKCPEVGETNSEVMVPEIFKITHCTKTIHINRHFLNKVFPSVYLS